MTTFDLDALTAAMEMPSFKLANQTYTGRLMGYLDFLKWTGELQRMAAAPDSTEADVERTIRGVLGAMQFSVQAVDALLNAPRPLVQQVLNHFFKLHRLPKSDESVAAGAA